MRRNKKTRELPDFASEENELRFWETHDARDFDAGSADDIVLAIDPLPKNSQTKARGPDGAPGDPEPGTEPRRGAQA